MLHEIVPHTYLPDHPDTGGWKNRHQIAMHRRGPIAAAIVAWVKYAQNHAARFDSNIGDAYVLGPAWARWGLALRELLNGETGGLDCGTLDHILYENLKRQGFDPDTWRG